MTYPRPVASLPVPRPPEWEYGQWAGFTVVITADLGYARPTLTYRARSHDALQALRDAIGRMPDEMTGAFFRADPVASSPDEVTLVWKDYTFTVATTNGRVLT